MTTDEPLVQLDFNVPNETTQPETIDFVKDKDEKQPENQPEETFLTKSAYLSDDRQSLISLSSSSTTEEICLVPEVGFDNINLDCSDNRESQPLLGARDQPDYAYNSFPGMFKYFSLIIRPYCHSVNFPTCFTTSYRLRKKPYVY